MSHSHLGPRHLLAQIESHRSTRTNRDIRPEWLNGLIEDAAASFEPLTGVARVGYECQPDEGGWSLSIYLGAVEVVGGKADGQTTRPGFRCDLQQLLLRFARIDSLEWICQPPGSDAGTLLEQSAIDIRGMVGTSPVYLRVRSTAPDTIGPGLRQFPDGRVESV
jgi:hypothetical protein